MWWRFHPQPVGSQSKTITTGLPFTVCCCLRTLTEISSWHVHSYSQHYYTYLLTYLPIHFTVDSFTMSRDSGFQRVRAARSLSRSRSCLRERLQTKTRSWSVKRESWHRSKTTTASVSWRSAWLHRWWLLHNWCRLAVCLISSGTTKSTSGQSYCLAGAHRSLR